MKSLEKYFSWNPKGYKNFNATLKWVWSHCVCSVKTTTPIIFDHTHAHSKTLRAAEETSREGEDEEKKNTKQKLCKIQKKSFLELSHILIMIDNEIAKKTHWQKNEIEMPRPEKNVVFFGHEVLLLLAK